MDKISRLRVPPGRIGRGVQGAPVADKLLAPGVHSFQVIIANRFIIKNRLPMPINQVDSVFTVADAIGAIPKIRTKVRRAELGLGNLAGKLLILVVGFDDVFKMGGFIFLLRIFILFGGSTEQDLAVEVTNKLMGGVQGSLGAGVIVVGNGEDVAEPVRVLMPGLALRAKEGE